MANSTALTILNKALIRLGMPQLTGSPVFTNQTGFTLLVISHLQEAQNLLMQDIKGLEPISLQSQQSITIAKDASTNALPTDLYHNRLNYLYVLDDDDENAGEIDIITKRHYDLNGTFATEGIVKAYIDDTNLTFTEDATEEQSLILEYINTPTPLTTYNAVCDFAPEFDFVLVYKTLQLANESRDQAQMALMYKEKYLDQRLKMTASTSSYNKNNKVAKNKRIKFSGTW